MTDDDRMLADDVAIRNLIALIAHTADVTNDLEGEYLRLFIEDGVWEVLPNEAAGLDRILLTGHAELLADRIERRNNLEMGPGTDTLHINTTLRVDVDGTDVAHAVSYWMALGTTSTAPTVVAVGQYDDTFHRTAGGWKFAYRRVRRG